VQRNYLGENVLFTISYMRVAYVVYLKYSLGFVIHLVIGEENSVLLIFGSSKRSCGVSINCYY